MIFKKLILGFLSLLISGFLILSIPLINFLLDADTHTKKIIHVAKVSVKKVELNKIKKRPKKRLRRPRRQKPARSKVKPGPRFGMDLSVMGALGVGVERDFYDQI